MRSRKVTSFGSLVLAIFFMANLFVVPAVLLNLLQKEASIETSSFLNNIEGPDVLEIKTGMALPYVSEWEEPKKGNGLLERNGEFYTLIEQNFENDTLYFKYIKNTNAREIFSMLSTKVHSNQDSESNQSSNGSNLLSNWMFLKFKSNSENSFAHFELYFKDLAAKNFSYFNKFSSISLGIDTPPPRLV